MSAYYWIFGLVTIVLFVYLLFALFRAEDMS